MYNMKRRKSRVSTSSVKIREISQWKLHEGYLRLCGVYNILFGLCNDGYQGCRTRDSNSGLDELTIFRIQIRTCDLDSGVVT